MEELLNTVTPQIITGTEKRQTNGMTNVIKSTLFKLEFVRLFLGPENPKKSISSNLLRDNINPGLFLS